MQADIKDFLSGRGIEWEEADDLAEVAGDVDVLYQTRIQKERFQVSTWIFLPSTENSHDSIAILDGNHTQVSLLSITGMAMCDMIPSSCSVAATLLTLQDRPQEYEQARGKYIIDNETMKVLSKDAIIMHPLPRVDEVIPYNMHTHTRPYPIVGHQKELVPDCACP